MAGIWRGYGGSRSLPCGQPFPGTVSPSSGLCHHTPLSEQRGGQGCPASAQQAGGHQGRGCCTEPAPLTWTEEGLFCLLPPAPTGQERHNYEEDRHGAPLEVGCCSLLALTGLRAAVSLPALVQQRQGWTGLHFLEHAV